MLNLQGLYAQPGRLLAQSLHRSGLRASDLASAVQKCPSCEPLSGGPYPKTSSSMHFRQSATGLMPENIHCQLYMALKPKKQAHTKATSAQPKPNRSHEGPFCTRHESAAAAADTQTPAAAPRAHTDDDSRGCPRRAASGRDRAERDDERTDSGIFIFSAIPNVKVQKPLVCQNKWLSR